MKTIRSKKIPMTIVEIEDNTLVIIKNMGKYRETVFPSEFYTYTKIIPESCDVVIDKSVADKFKDIEELDSVHTKETFLTYDLGWNAQTKEVLDDGTLIYHVLNERK